MALNLVQQRGGPSVWESRRGPWAWDPERWIALMIAGGLLFSGMRRRSAAGFLMAAAGGALAWWAAASRDTRTHRRAQLRPVWPLHLTNADLIGEASEESFPASDAPAWTPTTGYTGPREGSRNSPS